MMGKLRETATMPNPSLGSAGHCGLGFHYCRAAAVCAEARSCFGVFRLVTAGADNAGDAESWKADVEAQLGGDGRLCNAPICAKTDLGRSRGVRLPGNSGDCLPRARSLPRGRGARELLTWKCMDVRGSYRLLTGYQGLDEGIGRWTDGSQF